MAGYICSGENIIYIYIYIYTSISHSTQFIIIGPQDALVDDQNILGVSEKESQNVFNVSSKYNDTAAVPGGAVKKNGMAFLGQLSVLFQPTH